MSAAARPDGSGSLRATGRLLCDCLGRKVDYLRLSLTRACSMRCSYCRPSGVDDGGRSELLAPTELEALVRHLAHGWGLTKVRLTGGEPTQRAELTDIIARLARVPGVESLAMTTNGLSLARHAGEYARAGLARVNVSLDAVTNDRFARITGTSGLPRVLAGLEAARAAGLEPIRLNTVVVRGQNDDQLPEVLRFAASHGYEVRFIELMPMGPLSTQHARRYVPTAEVRQRLASSVAEWHPLPNGSEPARRFLVRLTTGELATVGFISPLSCNFCDLCNRIRVAADGAVHPCLMTPPHGSVLPALRPALDDALLERVLRTALAQKAACHPEQGHGVMTHIGG